MADGQVVIDVTADTAKFNRAIGSLGKVAAVGMLALGAVMAGVGIAALKVSTDFNKGMANVASLIPGNTARVGELKGAVQDMAVAFGASTSDLTAGLYQSISAFGDTADTMKLMEINTKAAAAGVATVRDSINLTSAVTKAYGDTSAASVQKVSDLALMTVRLGQTTFPELAASIGRVTPMSKNLNISQEELFATMATLTGVTGGAAEVSTQLAAAQRALAKPTKDAMKAFKAAGFSSAQAAINSLGYVGALGLLTDAAKTTHQPLANFIQDQEGQTFALAITGAQAGDYTKKLEAMKNAAGATDAAFAEQATGINALGFAFERLKQLGMVALQNLGDAIGNALGPELSKGVDSLSGALDGMVGMIAGDAGATAKFQAGITAFAGNLGNMIATIAPGLLAGLGAVVVAIATAIPAILPSILTGLVNGLVMITNALPGMMQTLVPVVMAGLMMLIAAVPQILPGLIGGLVALFVGIITALPGLFTTIVNALVAAIPMLILGAVQLFTAFGQALPIVLPQLITALMTGLNQLIAMLPILLPVILQGAIALFMGLVQAQPLIIPALLNGIVTLVTTIVNMLPVLLPMLLNAAIQLFMALVQAAPVILPPLTNAILNLVGRVILLIPTLVGALLQAALNLWTTIVNSVPQVAAGLSEAVTKLMNRAKDVLPTFIEKFNTAGKDVIGGIIKGVEGSVDALKGAVRNAAQKALDAAKNLLGINSPSRLFRDVIGAGIIEGWAAGIDGNTRSLISSVEGTITAMVRAAEGSNLSAALAVSPGFVPAGAGFGGSNLALAGGSGGFGGGNVTIASGAIVIQLPAGTPAETARAAGGGVLSALARELGRN